MTQNGWEHRGVYGIWVSIVPIFLGLPYPQLFPYPRPKNPGWEKDLPGRGHNTIKKNIFWALVGVSFPKNFEIPKKNSFLPQNDFFLSSAEIVFFFPSGLDGSSWGATVWYFPRGGTTQAVMFGRRFKGGKGPKQNQKESILWTP